MIHAKKNTKPQSAQHNQHTHTPHQHQHHTNEPSGHGQTIHHTCTPVNKRKVAKDTARTTHQVCTPVNKRQQAKATDTHNNPSKHTGEQAPRRQGHQHAQRTEHAHR